ncbi:hypothetical protein C9374_010417 [Naegleria lovaniensis]|uniref:Uncharacterized protein n=1 Tax=Naegleria lovaniensis TaxID=51637 RepID=A0AA88KE36_NAELO|nr:uncharacterized protein C9374_010417 [Naegleria lovaniensis]KAG2374673.1 hypothetical protein C9374_010417 [Naegleria lovaniensis]
MHPLHLNHPSPNPNMKTIEEEQQHCSLCPSPDAPVNYQSILSSTTSSSNTLTSTHADRSPKRSLFKQAKLKLKQCKEGIGVMISLFAFLPRKQENARLHSYGSSTNNTNQFVATTSQSLYQDLLVQV